MDKYNLTITDIETGINRFLADTYASATISDNPELIYVSAGPGAVKTSIETYFKRYFKEKGEKGVIVNSDRIAEFHPYYEEALEELPEECYRITRQFVRPATPRIFDELREKRVSIINENTLDKGEKDIELAKKFKESGYKISINIMATDLFESRISCYEREAAMLLAGLTPRGCSKETQTRMYNSFVSEVKKLDEMGISDEINVYIRGENISKPPILRYKKGDSSYKDFYEAIEAERSKQRDSLINNPTKYLIRIAKAKETIAKYGINEVLTQNALQGLDELEVDFLKEVSRANSNVR